MPNKTRVLILGGGFGGLYAALHLDKTIARDQEVEITLASRDNFLLFTPMLPEVGAGDLDLTDIISPLRQMLKHVNVLIAEVDSIDPVERRVSMVRERYSPLRIPRHQSSILRRTCRTASPPGFELAEISDLPSRQRLFAGGDS
jgi:NADH dehydrogenase FAD-containing subunit